jgi:DNA-binding transcriptional regulator YiaG
MTGAEYAAIRQRLGTKGRPLSHAGMARLLGISQDTSGRWERGDERIPLRRVGQILALVGQQACPTCGHPLTASKARLSD